MKVSTGLLFILIGVTLLWLAVTGRLDRLAMAWDTLRGMPMATTAGGADTTGAANQFSHNRYSAPSVFDVGSGALRVPTLPGLVS